METAKGFAALLEREFRLPEPSDSMPLALDLFAGCGGLALGFEAAGFRTVGYEMDSDACETYLKNLHGHCHQIKLTDSTTYDLAPDVIIGGPPCQPFSVGGLQQGKEDPRNGFPAFLKAVSDLRPKVAVFENVRGMFYRAKHYLDHVAEQLVKCGYAVDIFMVQATHFGVPQNRERVLGVAYNRAWRRPQPSAVRPITAGYAISDLLEAPAQNARFLTSSMDAYIARYEAASKCVTPRDLHFEKPARTLTCRNLCGATADMMRVRLEDGRRRMLTVREAARLQSFPDWFAFSGAESSAFYQIGNAVPPLLAKALASAVLDCLASKPLSQPALRAANTAVTQLTFAAA